MTGVHMATEGNGEKLELQMEKVAHRVAKEYDAKVQRKFETFDAKLDKLHAGIGEIQIGVGKMETKLDIFCETAKSTQTDRAGQLTWFQRTITGAIWVAVVSGIIAIGFKVAQALAGTPGG